MVLFLANWAWYRRWRWCGLALLLLAAGQPTRAQQAAPATAPATHLPAPVTAQQAPFFALLATGDSIFAQKSGYASFTRALAYYDRAQALADRSGDLLLLAEAALARGRLYDAWNKEPQKTILYLRRAVDLLARLPAQRGRVHYTRYLLAHAYEKVPDSLHAVRTLRELHRDLLHYPDSTRRQLVHVVEMALSSTEVRQYALADTLLREFAQRVYIVNDPTSYDFLTHYYLVQSRLDVYYRHRPASPYLDSLQRAYRTATRRLDRLFLSQQLARLLADAGRYPGAYQFLSTAVRIGDSLVDGGDLTQMRQALVASEQREQAQALVADRTRLRAVWGLSAGLVIISLLSFYLSRQGRRAKAQARELAAANHELGAANQELATASQAVAAVNHQLDDKVAQVELLNKEIQHRVKNNLHIIYSLLRMQERRTTSPEVLEQLQAARLRVESIATLHNQLLRNPAGLDMAEYMRALISAVVACLANGRQVVTHLRTDDLDLPTDSHFPLSLILNELVTNSIKYADTGTQALEINVSVTRRAHDTCIAYADNGRPAAANQPTHPRPDHELGGLGTQIIVLLARQLNGVLSTHPDRPFHYELCIPN